MSAELHPALVHFPIALLVAGALLSWWECGRGRLEESVDLVLALAFLSALISSWAGEGALARLILTPDAAAAVAVHEQWGTWTTWAAGGGVAVRLALRWRQYRRAGPGIDRGREARLPNGRSGYSRRWAAASALACSLAAVLALIAGYHGGHLVHGLGITPSVVPQRAPGPAPEFEGFQAAPQDSAS